MVALGFLELSTGCGQQPWERPPPLTVIPRYTLAELELGVDLDAAMVGANVTAARVHLVPQDLEPTQVRDLGRGRVLTLEPGFDSRDVSVVYTSRAACGLLPEVVVEHSDEQVLITVRSRHNTEIDDEAPDHCPALGYNEVVSIDWVVPPEVPVIGRVREGNLICDSGACLPD